MKKPELVQSKGQLVDENSDIAKAVAATLARMKNEKKAFETEASSETVEKQVEEKKAVGQAMA